MSETTVFVCDRGRRRDIVTIQLEIPREILEAYKKKAATTTSTPKQMMENMLRNWIDGVAAT